MKWSTTGKGESIDGGKECYKSAYSIVCVCIESRAVIFNPVEKRASLRDRLIGLEMNKDSSTALPRLDCMYYVAASWLQFRPFLSPIP